MPALPSILSRWIERRQRLPAPEKPEMPAVEGPLRVVEARARGGESLSEPEVEAMVRADFAALSGQIVLAEEIEGYDDDGISEMVYCDPPAVVRILPSTPDDHVVRWMDDVACDPTYLVEVVEPHAGFANVRPVWMYATSRSTDGTVDPGRFAVAPEAFQAWYAGKPATSEEDHKAAERVPAPAMAP